MSRFFTFSQNNSGGVFDVNKETGIGEYVIVEAADYNEANARAESIGLYFDGVAGDMDCECCGDRWYSQWSDDKGNDVPSIYDTPVEESEPTIFRRGAYVHYLDGSFKYLSCKEKE